jgi:AcrR family transcriptional regulator/acyl-coenzyme A thioesterase PaaI-like protein
VQVIDGRGDALMLTTERSNPGSIAERLGIETLSATSQAVVVALMPDRHSDTGADDVILALADHAASTGIRLGCPAGHSPATVGSTLSRLERARGGRMQAEAKLVYSDADCAVWRTVVRSDKVVVAELIKVAVYQPAEDAAATPARDERPSGHSLPEELVAALQPPPRPRRGNVVDERRRQIWEAACRVIAEKGFAKASVREIAAAAEMPVPTMYQYLKRKEDLLYGIYEYFMQDLAKALNTWRSSTAPAAQKIEGAIRTMIAEFDKNHRYIKIMFQETRSLAPEARQRVYDLDRRYITILRELIEQVIAEGKHQISDPELAANFVYFLCVVWPLRFWAIGHYGRETVTDEIVGFILRALGLAPEAKRS